MSMAGSTLLPCIPRCHQTRCFVCADSRTDVQIDQPRCTSEQRLQERIHQMVTHDARQAEQTRHECFLCVLAQQPCAVPQLEGHIISAHEVKVGGEITPFITITLGEEYASFSMTRHYRILVQGLMDLGSN